jgi:hypothetical protein
MIADVYLSGVPRRVVGVKKKEVRNLALFAELEFGPRCGSVNETLD